MDFYSKTTDENINSILGPFEGIILGYILFTSDILLSSQLSKLTAAEHKIFLCIFFSVFPLF